MNNINPIIRDTLDEFKREINHVIKSKQQIEYDIKEMKRNLWIMFFILAFLSCVVICLATYTVLFIIGNLV